MITPSFSLTATERVLPKMALDFTTASLDSRVTFTRTGATATRVNSSGLIEGVAADTARFDYNPTTLACKGLLIEESRINRRSYSEQFDNAAWTKTASSISANATTAPDGTTTADKLVEDSTSAQHYVVGQVTGIAITTYTVSFFAKAAGRDWIFLTEGNNITASAWFNLSTGAVGTVSGNGSPSATITDYGNGWYRCTMTATVIAGTFNVQLRLGAADTVGTYQGDGTSGAYIWGAQLEAGAFATSYIPTTTAAVTRNADVATMTGTNFSDWYNATEGTFQVNTVPMYSSPSGTALYSLLAATNGTFTTEIKLYLYSNFIAYNMANAGVTQSDINLGTQVHGSVAKVLAAYKTDSIAGCKNASTVGTDSSATVPVALDRLYIGCRAAASVINNNTGQYYNGHISRIGYWQQRLLNNEVQAFSK
tara:strand:- start:1369 stop:2640 length:1272 start_codon:yes stop_codon:yes gene_type:complete